MDKFYKINVKDQKPEVSGWYDTDKGRVFFFHNEGEFSCRQDYISEEYPSWWLKKDSNQEMQEFLLWLYPSNWVIYQNDKGLYFENIELGRTALFQEVFEIFIKETSDGKN